MIDTTNAGPRWVEIASRLAANRAEYFRLLDELKHEAGTEFKAATMAGLIDSTFDGRDTLSGEEALWLLTAAAIEGARPDAF